MLTLLQNITCYCPQPAGPKDILAAGDRIYQIAEPGKIDPDNRLIGRVFRCGGLLAFPGLIDQHVHILGGGGEQGFSSRVKELDIREAFEAGVATLVGLLGADGCTRSPGDLYAKAKALEAQGLTTYLYSGSYAIPAVTLTGSLLTDLVYIDKVIGAGEIAIADHRSSQPDVRDLLKLAAETHLGGLLGGKAGVVHLHVGDGAAGLSLLTRALEGSDLPREMFVPTHVNRNPALFRQAAGYWKSGGNIDLTAGEKAGIPVPNALAALYREDASLSRVTVSSDANGSVPEGGVTSIGSLFGDIVSTITQQGVAPGDAFLPVTENAAKVLKLYPQKGRLREGGDADILITDKNYKIQMLFCRGKLVLDQRNTSAE